MLKQFVPPIAVTAAKTLLGRNGQKPTFYPDFATAQAQCTNGAYENETLCRVVAEKTKRFRDSIAGGEPINITDAQAYGLAGVLAAMDGLVRVLDFGGACGHHYFIARQLMPKYLDLPWLVMETPEMVKQAENIGNGELHFTANPAEMIPTNLDLVHTSGALSYTGRPLEVLQELVNLEAEHILISRQCLTTSPESVYIVQESMLSANGPGPLPEGFTDGPVRYAAAYPPQAEFMRIIEEKYRIIARFDDKSGVPHGYGEMVGLGVLGRLK